MVMQMIERELIGKLIYDPELIKTCRVKTHWVSDKNLRDVLDVLVDSFGQPINSSQLFERVKQDVPSTALTADAIEEMRLDGMMAGDMDQLTRGIEERYYRNQVTETSRAYSDYPSNSNLEMMQDALRELEELDRTEEDGSLGELHERLAFEMENDVAGGVKTYRILDQALSGGLYPGELNVIGARPGVGKTAFGINLAIQALTRNEDAAVDFFTLEMPRITMYKRFITRVSEINGMRLRNPYKTIREDEREVIMQKSKEFLSKDLKIFSDKNSLDELAIQIRRRHHEVKGKQYVPIIDYLQLIEVGGYSENKNIEVGRITRTLKLLANELEIPIIVLSQLNREMKPDERPQLSNLRDSGNIEQDASQVMFLFNEADESIGEYGGGRPETTNRVICYVAKNRNGITGDVFYRFLKSKMYFQELDE